MISSLLQNLVVYECMDAICVSFEVVVHGHNTSPNDRYFSKRVSLPLFAGGVLVFVFRDWC